MNKLDQISLILPSRNNLKYLHCAYCTGGTVSASAASNTLVYYLPFTVGGPENVSVKAAVQSAATSPGASPGTITAKIYGASITTGNLTRGGTQNFYLIISGYSGKVTF